MGYATAAWPQHDSIAEAEGADQSYLVDRMQLPNTKFFDKWVELYLNYLNDCKVRITESATMLHFAAGLDLLSVVPRLLALREDINVKDSQRETPLHYAPLHYAA